MPEYISTILLQLFYEFTTNRWNPPGLLTFFHTVAVTLDIHRRAVMQNPVKNCRSDDGIQEYLTPLAV